MQKVLDDERLIVFAELNVVKDVVEGIIDVSQANGMAGMQSNTVMLGWAKSRARQAEYLKVIHKLEILNKSLILGRIQPKRLFPRDGRKREIHIWWGGLQRNGDLMLLLAYLLTRNPGWRDARIKVLSIASNEMMKEQTVHYLGELLPEIRIEAEPKVILKPEGKNIRDIIQEESSGADVVFFGLATPDEGKEMEYAQRLEDLAGDLPTVFFVKNASLFIGKLLEPSAEPGK
jgi:potassium/chloride transporter 4/5/6